MAGLCGAHLRAPLYVLVTSIVILTSIVNIWSFRRSESNVLQARRPVVDDDQHNASISMNDSTIHEEDKSEQNTQTVKVYDPIETDKSQQVTQSSIVYDPLENTRKEQSILDDFVISPFFVKATRFPSPDEISAATTLTLDRLDRLLRFAKMWKTSPISAAVLVNAFHPGDIRTIIALPNILSPYQNVDIHLLINKEDRKRPYPNNALRQLSSECARTEFVFTIDVDLIPSANLETSLAKYAKIFLGKESGIKNQTVALITTAFGLKENLSITDWRKRDILIEWEKGNAVQFQKDIWEQGHHATNYTKWRSATVPYAVNFEYGYEPYTILSKPFPAFDERFQNGWYDKRSHIEELNVTGYKFVVLPSEFIVHMPHPQLRDVEKMRKELMFYYNKYNNFKKELKNREAPLSKSQLSSQNLIMTGYVHPGTQSSLKNLLQNPTFSSIEDGTIPYWTLKPCSDLDIYNETVENSGEALQYFPRVSVDSCMACSAHQIINLTQGINIEEYGAVLVAVHGYSQKAQQLDCYLRVSTSTGSNMTTNLDFTSTQSRFKHTLVQINRPTEMDQVSLEIHIGIREVSSSKPLDIDESTSPQSSCYFQNLTLTLLPRHLASLRITPNVYVGDLILALERDASVVALVVTTAENFATIPGKLNTHGGPISMVLLVSNVDIGGILRGLETVEKRWIRQARIHLVTSKLGLAGGHLLAEEMLDIARRFSESLPTSRFVHLLDEGFGKDINEQ